MKRWTLFLIVPVLISVFLTSESFAFSNITENNSASYSQGDAIIQNPLQHTAIFVEEVGTIKTFEQNFYPKISFCFEINTRYNQESSGSPLSKNKDNFVFKKNLKRLLSQQIFPFHLFW